MSCRQHLAFSEVAGTATPSVAAGDAPVPPRRLFLDVPFEQKDEVKRLGARWDPAVRRWFVSVGIDLERFGPWLPVGCHGPTTTARVLLLPENCYRCDAVAWSIAGVLVDPEQWCDPDGFVEFGLCVDVLAAVLEPAELAHHHVGVLRRRHSSAADADYLSNGCWSCGALMGSHYVAEAVTEFLAEGGRYEELHTGLSVDFPIEALRSAMRFLSGVDY
jgi:hypothetical protein